MNGEMGSLGIWHWILSIIFVIFICFKLNFFHPDFISNVKFRITNLIRTDNDFSRRELITRLTGICGLIFTATLILTLTGMNTTFPSNLGMRFGYVLGSSLAPISVGLLVAVLYCFISFSFGKKVNKKLVFYLTLIVSLLIFVFAIIGGSSI